MRAYWEGKKELFSGLEIEKLEADNPEAWEPYPVLYFDFNGIDYTRIGALDAVLDDQLTNFEINFNCNKTTGTPDIRFKFYRRSEKAL